MFRPIVVLLGGLLASCGGRHSTSVRVTVPDLDGVETAVPGLMLTLLPYDRDSVIAALEAKAPPRPHVRELDSLFREFQGPFLALLSAEAQLSRPGSGPTSRSDSIAAATRLTQARLAMTRARERLWPMMDSLRADLKRWERTAYRGYDSVVRARSSEAYLNPVADTTGPTGWATVSLPKGRWWVTTRAVDPKNPNAEWYWNLPVVGDTLRLDPRTGHNRPRY